MNFSRVPSGLRRKSSRPPSDAWRCARASPLCLEAADILLGSKRTSGLVAALSRRQLRDVRSPFGPLTPQWSAAMIAAIAIRQAATFTLSVTEIVIRRRAFIGSGSFGQRPAACP